MHPRPQPLNTGAQNIREFYINVAKITNMPKFGGGPQYAHLFRTDWQRHDEAERTFRLLDRTLSSPEYKVTVHSRSTVQSECTSEFRTGLYPDSPEASRS